MSELVTVQPDLLRWARERASCSTEELARKLHLKPDRVNEWEVTGRISLSHVERIAEATHTPVGYLFLSEPPDEELPILDFRSSDRNLRRRPSPELLDTIYACQQRQAWFREHLVAAGQVSTGFVGSACLADDPENVARQMRSTLGLEPNWRPRSGARDALSELVHRLETLGVLVMRNGVVGNNTHRRLDSNEFRGFALADPLVPLIFVNASDPRTAQVFTLAHELAHLWLGQSAVSDTDPDATRPEERFCNRAAGEFLIPAAVLRQEWRSSQVPDAEVRRLAREFGVSELALLLRGRDAGLILPADFRRLYGVRLASPLDARTSSGGGNFYATLETRVGSRFARAVISSTLEGETPYSEAFELLGVRKTATFTELARRLEDGPESRRLSGPEVAGVRFRRGVLRCRRSA